MNLQEKIEAIIDKVKWAVKDNEAVRKIVEAKNDINILANVEPSGQFELEQLKFVGTYGELYVASTQITYFVDDDDVFGTVLLQYNGWDDLLNRNA